jgi:hypothetical protein
VNDAIDTATVFGFLSFFSLWGGSAFGAGISARRWLPVAWGLLVGATPFYFGIERVLALDAWGGLVWQVGCFVAAAIAVGWRMPRLRSVFLKDGASALMTGTFIMVAGAALGALFFRNGSEALSLIVGGIAFIFGAMWFGSGLKQLRGR